MSDVAIKARAQDINFVTRFQKDLHNLLAVLNKADVNVVAPGTAFKIYKSAGTLDNTVVGEKELIPDSDIQMDDGTLVELTYQKYRNLVSAEKIGKVGYDVAVGGSNDSLLRQVQKGIRSTIFSALGTGTGEAEGADFQSKVAAAAAYLSEKFEDEAFTPVCFANPQDAYGYLGTHNVSLEQSFGLSYLSNFMGMGNVIIDSNVPVGTIIGTASENLDVVAASITSIPGMEMETDETGIVAVHTGGLYSNASIETVAYCGVAVQPLYTDRIVLVTTAVAPSNGTPTGAQ